MALHLRLALSHFHNLTLFFSSSFLLTVSFFVCLWRRKKTSDRCLLRTPTCLYYADRPYFKTRFLSDGSLAEKSRFRLPYKLHEASFLVYNYSILCKNITVWHQNSLVYNTNLQKQLNYAKNTCIGCGKLTDKLSHYYYWCSLLGNGRNYVVMARSLLTHVSNQKLYKKQSQVWKVEQKAGSNQINDGARKSVHSRTISKMVTIVITTTTTSSRAVPFSIKTNCLLFLLLQIVDSIKDFCS